MDRITSKSVSLLCCFDLLNFSPGSARRHAARAEQAKHMQYCLPWVLVTRALLHMEQKTRNCPAQIQSKSVQRVLALCCPGLPRRICHKAGRLRGGVPVSIPIWMHHHGCQVSSIHFTNASAWRCTSRDDSKPARFTEFGELLPKYVLRGHPLIASASCIYR